MKKEKIIEAIENMTVMELSDLVKDLEEKFDVDASAPVAMAAAPQAQGAQEEEQTEFDVVLSEAGDQRLKVIKAVKDIGGFKLPEAKKFVDSAPKALKEGIPKEEAEEIKSKWEGVGAKVELK